MYSDVKVEFYMFEKIQNQQNASLISLEEYIQHSPISTDKLQTAVRSFSLEVTDRAGYGINWKPICCLDIT